MGDSAHALEQAGFKHLSVIDAKGLLQAVSSQEQDYSMEIGARVTNEIKLELFCEDEDVETVVDLISTHGRTGQKLAGWIYQVGVDQAWPISAQDHDQT